MSKAFLYENKKIFYRIAGTGKPVMFVHGFGEDGSVWLNQIESLKDKYQLIIPDLPGSGQSEAISDMSMEGMAEVIHTIIHQENFDTVTLIGHSMGGYITLAFVEKYWNHANAFGLVHSTAFADTEEKIATRKKGIEFINQHGAFEFLKTITPNLFSANSKSGLKTLITSFIESLSAFSADTLISYYEAMIKRPDRTSVLKKASVPVLFVAGQDDIAVPLEDVLKQVHFPVISHFHILKNSGHMGMLEEPKNLNMILDDFLSG